MITLTISMLSLYCNMIEATPTAPFFCIISLASLPLSIIACPPSWRPTGVENQHTTQWCTPRTLTQHLSELFISKHKSFRRIEFFMRRKAFVIWFTFDSKIQRMVVDPKWLVSEVQCAHNCSNQTLYVEPMPT